MNNYLPKSKRIYNYKCDKIPFKSSIDNMYHYTYKIVEDSTGKYYLGMHSTLDIDDGYSGSGFIVCNIFRKKGTKGYTKYILNFYNSREDLIKAEELLITINELNDPLCYNLIEGGRCALHNENINSQSKNSKGCVYMYNYNINKRTRVPKEDIDKYKLNGWTLGYGPIPDAVKNSGTKGMVPIHKEDKSKWININDLEYFLKNGWIRGHSYIKNKGFKYMYIIDKDNNIHRNMVNPTDIENKLKIGWHIGYGPVTSQTIINGTIKGKIYISNKNGDMKTIFPDEINEYINNGWSKGLKGNIPHHHALVGRKRIYNPKDNVSKIVNVNDVDKYISNGWVIGMGHRKPSGKGINTFIHKGNEYKKVKNTEIQKYIDNGWEIGGPAKGTVHIVNSNGGHKMVHKNEVNEYINRGWTIMKSTHK